MGFHLPGQVQDPEAADVLLEALLDQIQAVASRKSLRCTSKALGSIGGVPKEKLGIRQRQVSLATPD